VGVAYSSTPSRHTGLRRWPVPGFRNYLVFYRSVGADVEIVRVLHAARDINVALEEDDDGLIP
jgi:toxin ParE1/3/4